MKTKIITGALLLCAALTQAQSQRKETTVRIETKKTVNGVTKITDTTFTSLDDADIMLANSKAMLEDGKIMLEEFKHDDGSAEKVIIVDDNLDAPEIVINDTKKGEPLKITIKSPGALNGKPVEKTLVINDLSGTRTNNDTKVIVLGKTLSPEEEQVIINAEKNGDAAVYQKMIIVDAKKDKNGKELEGEKLVTKVYIYNKFKVTDISAEDARLLGGQTNGAENNLQLSDMRVYPNPAGGKFNLSFNLPGKGNTQVSILNAEGKTIYSESLAAFSGKYDKEVDISQNPKGVYFVRIEQGKNSQLKKIVLE